MSSNVRNLSSPRIALLLLGTVALAVPMAGCAPKEPKFTGSIETDGYRTRHPIVVEEGTETLDLPVGPQSAQLPVKLRATVESFAREARRNGASGVTVLVPSGSTNEVAAHRVLSDVTRALIAGGIPARAIDRQAYAAAGPEDVAPIRLAYPRTVARVPHECGDWPGQATPDWTNGDYWNFGCATQANLAAEVDNPADLIAPASLGRSDATRDVGVVQSYRKGQSTKSQFDLPDIKTSGGSGG